MCFLGKYAFPQGTVFLLIASQVLTVCLHHANQYPTALPVVILFVWSAQPTSH